MSEEVLREKVQRLVNNFWEQLREVLEVSLLAYASFSQAP
jgi:malonyl CoA-acyl carrier protein transacylase